MLTFSLPKLLLLLLGHSRIHLLILHHHLLLMLIHPAPLRIILLETIAHPAIPPLPLVLVLLDGPQVLVHDFDFMGQGHSAEEIVHRTRVIVPSAGDKTGVAETEGVALFGGPRAVVVIVVVVVVSGGGSGGGGGG